MQTKYELIAYMDPHTERPLSIGESNGLCDAISFTDDFLPFYLYTKILVAHKLWEKYL